MLRLTGSVNTTLAHPKCVAVDSDGNIFAGCAGYNGGLEKFTHGSNRAYESEWCHAIGKVMGVALTDAGHVFCTVKSDRHEVRVYKKCGGFLYSWGSTGAAEGQFSTPTGIASDGKGYIYVAEGSSWPAVQHNDTWVVGGNRLQKFDSDGFFIWQVSGFNVPIGVAADKKCRVYLSDTYNCCVRIFNENGELIKSFGEYGSSPGKFNCPQGIAVDRRGNIYVADVLNNRVQKFNGDGLLLDVFGNEKEFWLPCGIAVDESNRVFVADTMNQRIKIYEQAGDAAQ
ncbi:MAG: NHL repeat-containing protein [Defluviitaleaceae bacterium]|nr:NHL repeat-containing protein [Defluviitaleaceae bacterium]